MCTSVRTAGTAAVQIALSCHLGSRDIEHIGSAQDDADLEILKASAQQRLVAGRARLTWAWSAPIQRSGMRVAARCRSRDRGWAICEAASVLRDPVLDVLRPDITRPPAG
ncbi:MAG TPA: hypothetical protein VF940_05830 [Streptosporangiaceae bacterium]